MSRLFDFDDPDTWHLASTTAAVAPFVELTAETAAHFAAELAANIARIEAEPVAASVAVAPDVWAAMQKLPHEKRLDGLPSLPVRVDPWLPFGRVVPLDAKGMPMSRLTDEELRERAQALLPTEPSLCWCNFPDCDEQHLDGKNTENPVFVRVPGASRVPAATTNPGNNDESP